MVVPFPGGFWYNGDRMRRKALKLGLIVGLCLFVSGAESTTSVDPSLGITVNDRPVVQVKDFLIQNNGVIYLSVNNMFPKLGAKADYSPDLSIFFLSSRHVKITTDLKTATAKFAGAESKFTGAFWKDGKLYVSEDFITEAYARARGFKILINKPETVKNYQSAFRLPEKIKRNPVNVIVIDPGHGGQSIGAYPSEGWREKDLTLKIAIKLQQKLQVPGIRVMLTRYSDEEVTLEKRAEFANKFDGDLFLSIHANACDSESASGFETYFLSLNASDEDSRKLAMWENLELSGARESHSGELSGSGLSELEIILGDMAQSEHLAESEAFAKIIQTNLAMIMKNPNRGVKQAPFQVLMGANMPAALVEVGFLTNVHDRANMLDEKNQDKIVMILANSILGFRELKARRLGMDNEGGRPQGRPAQAGYNSNRPAQIR